MATLENTTYEQTERFDSPSYWISQLALTVDSENEQNIPSLPPALLYYATPLLATDIKSFGADIRDGFFLELSACLEADDDAEAMTKISGLSLLAMRKAGMDLTEIILIDGRLTTGETLSREYSQSKTEGLAGSQYALADEIEDIFLDMHQMMIEYDAPETY